MHTTLPIRLSSAALLVVLLMGCESSNPVAPRDGLLYGDAVQAGSKVTHEKDGGWYYGYAREWNECTGEYIDFEGSVHYREHWHDDGAGGLHYLFMLNDHALEGVGATSGTHYRRTGADTHTGHVSHKAEFEEDGWRLIPFHITTTSALNYIAPGRGNNLVLHVTWHLTYNANRELTAEVLESRLECR